MPNSLALSYIIEVDQSETTSAQAIPAAASVADASAITEHGRTYHSKQEAKYMFPNDAEEQNRLDLQHSVLRATLGGKLSLAPIDKPANVMDVATGTGIWAIDFAKENPGAKVIGIDLSAIQPDSTPNNVTFLQEDAEKDDWSHHPRFEYIHLRLVAVWFKDLERMLKKIYNQLAPGGWVEFQEYPTAVLSQDGSTKGSHFERLMMGLYTDAMAKFGMDVLIPLRLKDLLQKVGFVDVQEVVEGYPLGPWPKDLELKKLGAAGAANMLNVTKGVMHRTLMAAGNKEEELDKLADGVVKEVYGGGMHCYIAYMVIIGRRPL